MSAAMSILVVLEIVAVVVFCSMWFFARDDGEGADERQNPLAKNLFSCMFVLVGLSLLMSIRRLCESRLKRIEPAKSEEQPTTTN